MLPALPIGFELLLVLAGGWRLARWWAPTATGCIEPGLALMTAGAALVAGAGTVLGLAGWLNAPAWGGLLAGTCAGLQWLRRSRGADDRAAWRRWCDDWETALRGRGMVIVGLWALLALVCCLGVFAALAEPLVFDSLTYRLPRIGHWLQEGSLAHVAASDARMDYMPWVPDLLAAWLISPFDAGYRPAVLVSWAGGALLLAATCGLARDAGLRRSASLGAVVLVLGMGCCISHFTAAHTDLFTAGMLAAGACLGWRAARRGEGSVAAGVAAGLALGSKGSVLYLVPGAACWVVWFVRTHPLPLRAWARTATGAVAAFLLFVAPGWVANWRHYGDCFGPAEDVRMHHGDGLARAPVHKLALNLATSAVQLFQPDSQPHGLQGGSRWIGDRLAAALPEHDAFAFEGLDRRAVLQQLMKGGRPDADTATCGLVAVLLFVASVVWAAADRRRPGSSLVLVGAAGVVVFCLCFHAMRQWHPWGFRFLMLVAPWVAVAGAWGIETLRAPVRIAVWVLVGVAAADVVWQNVACGQQSGWAAVYNPPLAGSRFHYWYWREWAQSLDTPGEPLQVMVPGNRPLAAFYRWPQPRRVVLRPIAEAAAFATAEELVRARPGWNVVPADRFIGREGRVQGQVLLFGQSETDAFSLAAYRALRPDEMPETMIYRHRIDPVAGGVVHGLLVRTWKPELRLRLTNPRRTPLSYVVRSAEREVRGTLAAAAAETVALAVSSAHAAEIAVFLEGAKESSLAEVDPMP